MNVNPLTSGPALMYVRLLSTERKNKILMVAFVNAQDKESTVLVLCSTDTPPKLNSVGFLPLQMGRTVRNSGCTVNVKKKLQLL